MIMIPVTISKRSTITPLPSIHSVMIRTATSSKNRSIRSCGDLLMGKYNKIDTPSSNTPSRWNHFCTDHRRKMIVLFSSVSNKDDNFIPSSSSTNKKRIIFLGSPPVAAESLQSIYEASQQSDSVFDIVAVISQPAKRGKRGAAEPTAVSKMAQSLNIFTIMTPDKANDPTFLQQFIDSNPDLCITAAYGQYLPKKFLETPKYGTINIHPSLLPKWRGASPVQRSLEAGDNPLGVTVLYTVSKMDAGPIITQSTLEVYDHETTTTLLPKLFQIGTKSLIHILPSIFDGTITMNTARVQNEDDATHAKLITNDEAEFKVWQESATACHNRLRGFHMWPKAYMYIQISNNNHTNDENLTPPTTIKIKIHETRVIPNIQLAPTNIILTSIPNHHSTASATAIEGCYVVCYDGSVLELITVQPPSKTPYPARDLIHGYSNRIIRWIQQQQSNEDDTEQMSSATTTIKTTTNAT
jgi:methionyl-tRNA formyltransferase